VLQLMGVELCLGLGRVTVPTLDKLRIP
jgi:hypothetical protein